VKEPSFVHGKNPTTKTTQAKIKEQTCIFNANTVNFDDCVIYNTAGDFYLRTMDVSESKIHCDMFHKNEFSG
jgi:hypothetical protein